MGNKLGSIFGKKRYRIVMLGLDNAGKTSILTRLHLQEFRTTVPTVGFSVETIHFNRVQLNVWDIGGQDKIRPLWRHYFTGSQGLIYVIDSSDRERIDEARFQLERILNDREMRSICVLIFCNKQDVSGSLTPEEIHKALRLERLSHPYLVMPCSAYDGTGLEEGFTWLCQHCK